jgi:CheY-like chemotaxis protein
MYSWVSSDSSIAAIQILCINSLYGNSLLYAVYNIIVMSNHPVPEKKTVMICDDEQDLLLVFGLALGSKYNVIPVGSGEDCIEKYLEEKNRGNKIHLLLLDYRLGDMFGDSVARTIKQYNGIKIILISAYDLDRELVKELEENKYIVKYAKKPIHLANLIDLVADTIN